MTLQADQPEQPRRQRGECTNCGRVLAGPYCHGCGQPARSFIRALPGLIREIASDTLYYDSRMWRTLKALMLQPGHLSREYVHGRRARFTSPVRLYLVSSILAFLLVTLMVDTTDFQPASENDIPAAAEEESMITFGGEPWHREDNPLVLGWLGERGNAWLNDQIGRIAENTRRVSREPGRLVRVIVGMLPQTMFVMLPIFAALVATLYLFDRRYYIEHLLLQVHNHAFLFLILIGIWLLGKLRGWLDGMEAAVADWGAGLLGLAMVAALVWIPVYLLLSQKRFYAQGWILTPLKFVTLATVYQILLGLALGLVILVGLWRL